MSERSFSKSWGLRARVSLSPLSLPHHSLFFFALVPTFSTNSRGNACYAGYFLVFLERAEGCTLCPVAYLQRYFSARGATPGPLFCFADGSPVKTSQFTQQLQQALNFCGLDSTKYKSHSFRIGAASLAAEKGLSDAQIRHLGRWKSDAFKLYIRQPTGVSKD